MQSARGKMGVWCKCIVNHQDATLLNQTQTNIDWAGLLVERASGLKLNAYFKKYIFEPLGLQHISMFPTAEMKQHLAHMHQRFPDGTIEEREHLYRRPLTAQTPEDQDRLFNSGGAGCFARPTDYVQILSVLLNQGVHARTGHRLLQASTVDTMYENQVPQWPDFARQGIEAANKNLTVAIPELYPQEGNPPQGWGLTFFLNLKSRATGSGKNTAWWAGLSNLFWWADREKGVAGMIASQILPFGDLKVMESWFACEKAIYDGIQ
jgi:CubicO group peptidase (beta-lactamase class C family)